MPKDEINPIYNGEPGERDDRRKSLPRFELKRGEGFYIPRGKLVELNNTYFQLLDDMKAGFSITPEEMRSYMESVIFASYVGEIERMQREREIDCVHKLEVYKAKKEIMTPEMIRRLFRRRKPNYALHLCLKEAELEAEIENSVYREGIAKQEEYIIGASDGEDELFEGLIEEFVPRRKRKRFERKHGEYLKGLIAEFMQSRKLALKQQSGEEQPEEAEARRSAAMRLTEWLKAYINRLTAADAEPEEADEEIETDESELEELHGLEEE